MDLWGGFLFKYSIAIFILSMLISPKFGRWECLQGSVWVPSWSLSTSCVLPRSEAPAPPRAFSAPALEAAVFPGGRRSCRRRHTAFRSHSLVPGSSLLPRVVASVIAQRENAVCVLNNLQFILIVQIQIYHYNFSSTALVLYLYLLG